uniref:Uncharacterized protein n=1 Tax=Oryza rufipogon TaxID=4529 RepID=A0A0E0QFH6_ORYRU
MGTERKRMVSLFDVLRLYQARPRRHHQQHRHRRGQPVHQLVDGEALLGKYIDPQIHRFAVVSTGERCSGRPLIELSEFPGLRSSATTRVPWSMSSSLGVSVFRPLPSLPSTGQSAPASGYRSAFSSATALYLMISMAIVSSTGKFMDGLQCKFNVGWCLILTKLHKSQALKDMAAINFLEHLKMAIAGIIGQHKYTHITLKPSYAMYYVDLVMKFFSQFRKHFYPTIGHPVQLSQFHP